MGSGFGPLKYPAYHHMLCSTRYRILPNGSFKIPNGSGYDQKCFFFVRRRNQAQLGCRSWSSDSSDGERGIKKLLGLSDTDMVCFISSPPPCNPDIKPDWTISTLSPSLFLSTNGKRRGISCYSPVPTIRRLKPCKTPTHALVSSCIRYRELAYASAMLLLVGPENMGKE